MKTAIRGMVVSLLALVMGAALADGVPVITAGPPLAANDTARQLPRGADFVRLHPIVLNKSAFGANVLTVVIDGKEYRFVGSLMPERPPLSPQVTAAIAAGVMEKQSNTRAWGGQEPGGGRLVLSKDMDTGRVGVIMSLRPSREFNLYTPRGGSVVLVESDANIRPPLTYFGAASGVWIPQPPALPASATTPQRPALPASGGTQ